MSFFSVLFALMIEQMRPLPRDNWVHDGLISWVGWTGRHFDAGRERHAWVVWFVSVLVPASAAAVGCGAWAETLVAIQATTLTSRIRTSWRMEGCRGQR